jgi:hypothetical protein
MSVAMSENGTVTVRQNIKIALLEDKIQDIKPILDTLGSAGIFDIIPPYSSLKDVNFIEGVKDALIISLDVDIDSDTTISVQVARELLRQNPYRGVFFYTHYSKQVEDGPLNFILKKTGTLVDLISFTTKIRDIFHQICLRILVHDVCLAILKELTSDHSHRNQSDLDYIAFDLRAGAMDLRPALDQALNLFEQADSETARRYEELSLSLKTIIRTGSNELLAGSHSACQPLLTTILAEQAYLKQIKQNVRLRKGLEVETDRLKRLVIGQPLDGTLYSERETEAQEDAGAAVDLTRVVGVKESMIYEEPSVATEMDIEPAAWHLNIWFRDYFDKEKPLIVGQAAILEVSIGHPHSEAQMGTFSKIPPDELSLLSHIEYVDALVLCSGAEVSPLSCRIYLPPDQDSRPAEFEVTPRDSGLYDLTVMLLRKNDPIFEASFTFNVIAADTAG